MNWWKLSYALPALMLSAVSLFVVEAKAANQQEFIQKASMSNLFEIESSKLAQNRAQDPEVKAFAARMIEDHTKAGNDLKAVVRSSRLDSSLVASSLDEKHRDKIAKLNEKTGEDFDSAYMEMQEDAHDDAVSLFDDYAENGDNPELRQFAAKTLPTLRQHEMLTDEMD